jgi:tetratricopeptide (TPR) repeat protein
LRDQIIKHAEGVPLFIEELTRAALEGSAGSVPMTLRDSLAERLDRQPAMKRAAQLGAAIGRSFPHQLVTVVADGPATDLEQGLHNLVATGLADRRGAAPDAVYTFRHALVQDAAYESLSRSDRAAIHARIADTLIAHDAQIESSQPDLLAHHCEAAGLSDKAIDYYVRAGRRSVMRGALAEAGQQFQASLRLISTLPPGEKRDRTEMTALHAVNYVQTINLGYAHSARRPVLDRLLELFLRLGEPKEFLSSVHGIWLYLMNRGDLAGAMRVADDLCRRSEQRRDDCGLLLGLKSRGWIRALRGELLDARADFERVLELLETVWSEIAVADPLDPGYMAGPIWDGSHLFFAPVLAWLGYADQAIALVETALRPRRIARWPAREAASLGTGLRPLAALLAPSELLPYIEKLQELCRDQVAPQLAAIATTYRGSVIARSGDPVAGRTILAEGIAAFEATEATRICSYRALLAETHLMLGETDEALRILTGELKRVSQTGELWYLAELHRRIGEVHRQCGRTEAARASFEQALAIARRQCAKLWELQAATSSARLLRDEGKPDEARDVLAPVYAWFTEGFNTVPLREAQAVLAELGCAGRARP